jgi:Holliday junction resolvase-like predicted endonuclease
MDDASFDDEDGEGESEPAGVPEADAIARAIAKVDKRWKANTALEFDGRRWRPDLVRTVGNQTALLHIHVAERLRSYALQRMRTAYAKKIEVHIALPLRQLYDEALLREIVDVDPLIHIIGEPPVKSPPRLLACLADRGIAVSQDLRRDLATSGHTISQQKGVASAKGKRLEALLAFLLSQVDDFRVVERNYRTSTGEIDIVVQQLATTGRLWATLGAPLLLVEAKNRVEPLSQPMVSVFRSKMQTSRGGVRLGIMVAAANVTEDASLHELKFATENLTIAFMTKRELEEWIVAPEPDDWLERHFTRAMLR